jgi:hypothetical protein
MSLCSRYKTPCSVEYGISIKPEGRQRLPSSIYRRKSVRVMPRSQGDHRIVDEKSTLITGCGRSGTKYISRVLSSGGLDIGHEIMGKDGIASWLLGVDADSVPWGPRRRDFQFRTILHQVRHPLAVISSMQTCAQVSWSFICRHVRCELEEPLALRCAKYWRYWNEQIESEADWRYRIEDVQIIRDELCERTGCRVSQAVLAVVPRNINSRQDAYKALDWNTLRSLDAPLCLAIQEQAVRYGYRL